MAKNRVSHQHNIVSATTTALVLLLLLQQTKGSLALTRANRNIISDYGSQNYTLPESSSEKLFELSLEQLLQYYSDLEKQPDLKNRRSPRSLIPKPYDYCFTVSVQEAKEIVEQIKNIINYSPAPNESFIIYKDTSSTNCETAKARLSKSIENLSSLYLILKRNATQAEEEIQKLKVKYKQDQLRLENEIEEIKQQASEKLKTKISEKENEKQSLKFKLDKAIYDLQIFREQKKENLISLAVAQIDIENYKKARESYEQLNFAEKPEPIYLIIKRAYWVVRNFDNIFYFIDELSSVLHQAMAYDALMSEMENKNGSANYRLLTLEYYVLRTMKEKNHLLDSAGSKLLGKARKSLEEPVAATIDTIARKIQSGQDIQPIILYARSKSTEDAFEIQVKALVGATYCGDEENALRLLDLANFLTPSQMIALINELFSKIEKSDKLTFAPTIRMANKIKEITANDLPNPQNSLLTEMKNSLPQSIRSLIWDVVCIRHADSDGFLTESRRKNFEERVPIHLLKEKNGKYKWILKSYDGAKTFRVMNVDSNLFFYADMNQKGSYFTMNYDEQVLGGEWQLQDFDWKNGKFHIFNEPKQQYLAHRGENTWEIESCA